MPRMILLNHMKKIIIVVVVIIALIGGIYFWKHTNETAAAPLELCYARFGIPNAQHRGDAYTLKMTIEGSKVSGDLKFIPADKDRKVGIFDGTVSDMDKVAMTQTVDGWWATVAEGMNTTEQLKLIFNDKSAKVGLGEMVDRGDGVYVYKDANSIGYSLEIPSTSCTTGVFGK